MIITIYKCILLTTILQAANVVSTPPPGHVPTPPPVDEHPPKYEYGYVVNDQQQGSTQGHVETRDGIFALGRYHITLPDGSAQKVSYFADDWGYHPLVTYSSNSEHGSSRTEFAMGDKAVEALKTSGSPVGNLISSPSPTHAINTGAPLQTTPQYRIAANPLPVQPTPQQVHIVNAGASGHHDQSFNVNVEQTSTATVITTPTVQEISYSTTPAPPTQTVSVQTSAVEHQTAQTASTPEIQYSVTEHQNEIEKLEEINKQLHLQSFTVSTTQAPIETQSQGILQITPTNEHLVSSIQQQKQVSTAQSTLGSILLQETPQQGIHVSHGVYSSSAQNVQIVTPTPIIQHQPQYFLPSHQPLADNSIFSNGTEDVSTFTVEGNNVQISSYLADTNKVLEFGDRIPNKDRRTEQKIIDQIQQHAKLRILQDLQRNTVTAAPTLQPIVVSESVSPTPGLFSSTKHNGGSISVVSYNNGEIGYNNVVKIPHTTLQPTTAGDAPNLVYQQANAYLDSNSLAEKSDVYSQFRFGQSNTGFINYSPQPYNPVNQLASLQAGVAFLTAPERSAAPVKEETKEETVVDIQKGIALQVPQEEPQPQAEQYQALGYERRLVDAQAQQVVREPDPVIQEQKKTDLVIQQEIELRQVQNSLQELQQQIVNEIDAQHEEEQRKQKAVANERQKHQDNLQKVSEIINESKPIAQPQYQGPEYLPPHSTQETAPPQYQGPEYLPPHSTQETYQQYQGTNTAVFSGDAYQQVAISTTGQDVFAQQQQGEQQIVHLSPPPAPPTIAEIEKPVYIEKPVPIETTKIVEIEKPVLIKETVPIETTKVVEVEKTVPVLQPYPVTITRLVHVERPVSVPEPYGVPQPIPYPYAIPHPVGINFPQFIPYTELLPVPYKQYHPVFISTKTLPYKASGRYDLKPSKRMPEPAFKDPKPELFHFSHSYHTIPLHLKSSAPTKSSHYRHYYKSHVPHLPSYGRSRNSLKNLRIEYGGFKPPLIPSTELTEEPKPSPYGPSVKEERR